jgi:hypothetical protein
VIANNASQVISPAMTRVLIRKRCAGAKKLSGELFYY